MRQVLVSLSLLVVAGGICSLHRTKSTFALPLSLTLSTNDSSKPVAGSVNVRNAWCGRLAVFPSMVVRMSFSESVAPNDTDLARGAVALNLRTISTCHCKISLSIKLTYLSNLHQHRRLCWKRTR